MRHLLLWLTLATLATAPHAATTYTISRVYNAHGQLLQEQQADGTTRLYSYDANGNLQNHTDAQGRSQSYGYDALNRLETTSSPQFGYTRWRYDSLDQLASLTDPRGLTTRYQHNAFGELLSQISPDTGTTSYTYGPDSQPLTRQDARQASQYQYDPQGRLSQRTDGSVVTQYQYGSSGSATNRLTHLSTGPVSLQWQYHPDGQVQTHSQALDTHQFNTHYQHDTAGRLTQLRYPSGRLVHYRHDAQGRISSIHTQGNGDSEPRLLIDNVQYQPFGPARSWQYGNGHSYRRNYDQNGRISALTLGDILVTLGYEADRLGQQEWAGGLWQRLSSQQRVPAQPSRYQYGLSGPGGLARHSQGSATTTWQQDLNGNRIGHSEAGQARQYRLDPASNRLASLDGQTQQYDASGNLTQDGRNHYRYDDRGRLVEANGVHYVVDGLGQRVAKRQGNDTVYYHYDQARHLIAESDSQGRTVKEYLYLDDVPVGLVWEGQLYAIHPDHLGTPRLVTDSQRRARWLWHSEPFGSTAPLEDPEQLGQTLVLNLRFAGQYHDGESGLFYNGYRDYDPQTGRYIQSDPIGLAGGQWSTYAYVDGNPLGAVDPLGLTPTAVPVVIGGGLGVLICEADPNCRRTMRRAGEACASMLGGAGDGARRLWNIILNEDGVSHAVPPVPTDIVGDQSDPRAGPNKSGKKHTSGPLTPANGGTGNYDKDLEKLTGGTRPWQPGDKAPPGSQVGDNGIFGRPKNSSGGKSIDIPPNGTKPHETLHY